MISVKEYSDDIYVIDSKYAQLWVAERGQVENADYYYGGTRTVPYDSTDKECENRISYLKNYESGLKNVFINDVIASGSLEKVKKDLPEGYIGSKVGGGRCIIRPKSKETYDIIMDTSHPRHCEIVDSMFRDLGEFLNDKNGEIKLTPDFGRFVGLADMLHKYTENVLGVKCEDGGCGGKASYTSTGIIEAIEYLGFGKDKSIPVTLVGSDGAVACAVLEYLINEKYTDIAVCDISYDTEERRQEAERLRALGIKILPAEYGKFTAPCLERGGLFIAVTVGGELLNSDLSVVKNGTTMLMAHNEVITVNEESLSAIDKLLEEKDIKIVPGQLLTFGGAMTSRLEWFFRRSHNEGETFNKPVAHKVVRLAVDYLFEKYCMGDNKTNIFRSVYDLV
ncbi:hypothetical protein [Ruminococcus flavefaciens]|uniref:Uncharacterized protein n=1 Tax=Ruminococcus flavefaciens TaxID=1265 RepID=A0A315Y147_RUMFL|nr:hypothetical protein [Ruminococcus flavefaciens]PWJ12165.1 hypothetical protein IE37_01855 [Ruminococcus flavefaciens]SSA49654.1 hypothetical protein SAMN02910325_01855 [Ruminococcus flavefaciens]